MQQFKVLSLGVLLMAFGCQKAAAQIEIDDGMGPGSEVTIEVDTTHLQNKDKSLGLALLGSALIPGLGEAYLSESRSAKAFVLAEVGIWAALFMAWQAQTSQLEAARAYAVEFAGAEGAPLDAVYLERLESVSHRSYYERRHRNDSYELEQILNGNRDGDFPLKAGETATWDFGPSSDPANTAAWGRFRSSMRFYRGAKVAVSFALGALAFNRLGALAHTLRLYRRTSGKGLAFQVIPEFAPDYVGSKLAIGF